MFSSMHWITRRLEVAIHVREPHAILRGATDLGDLISATAGTAPVAFGFTRSMGKSREKQAEHGDCHGDCHG